MGLDYSLKLSTEMTWAETRDLIAKQMQGLQWSTEHSSFFNSDIIIAGCAMDRESQSIFEEGFGFRPSLSVLFRHPSNRDYENFARTMIQGTFLLLEHGRDGVLLFNGEIIVLQRMRGQLVFNADYRLYKDERWLKANVPVPFERRPLPSPFL
ncbi:hypothetical protein F0U62_48655 [Cystobacter fuscus]|uniref:SitI3 family protein n=1 Tax=Cystobacter fuscus TaxID=43 RepID=UPI002B2AE17B|nr:hypothetical protein F0U62_48655 [Cystobacter fuscus]